jgi:hypothetical protein
LLAAATFRSDDSGILRLSSLLVAGLPSDSRRFQDMSG